MCNIKLQQDRKSRSHAQARSGFALVLALSLMAFVLLLLLSITALVQVESQGAKVQMHREEAEQAALLGLNVALGKLQAATGADRRVTATAAIRSSSVDGSKHFVGVWDTTSVDKYDTAGTRDAGFMGWLVSAIDPLDLESLNYPDTAIANDGMNGIALFEAKDTVGTVIPEDSVNVALVPIDDIGAYAYWIEDEGLKAKVSYAEDAGRASNLSAEALQRSRLSASPGIDYRQLDNLFDGISGFKYPISHSDNDLWRNRLVKLSSEEQVPVLDPTVDETWLNMVRHDATLYSKGLLTNVRNGGFRKDLTLAFEMDSDQDDPNALENFNRSNTFAGSGTRDSKDATTAVGKRDFQDFYSRYLYAYDTASSSADTLIVRGPTWHNARDYYNLYKRMTKTGNSYRLSARAPYPNTPELSSDSLYPVNQIMQSAPSALNQDVALAEYKTDAYVYRFTRGSYSPVCLGYRFLISLFGVNANSAADTVEIGLALDPFVYLWNPFDVEIEVNQFDVVLGTPSYKLESTITVRQAGGAQQAYTTDFGAYLKANDFKVVPGVSVSLSDNGNSFVMKPGQVMVFSPSGPAQSERIKAFPGGNVGTTSGVVLPVHPDFAPGGGVLLENASTAEVDLQIKTTSAYRMKTRLVDTALSEERYLQQHFSPLIGFGNYGEPVEFTFNSVAGDELTGGSRIYAGYVQDLFKATLSGEGTGNLEVFATHNPRAAVQFGFKRWTSPNRFYNAASVGGLIDFTLGYEFDSDGQAYWGTSYDSGGEAVVGAIEIPAGPLISLASLRHADFALFHFEPMHALGNSLSSPYVPQDSIVHRLSSAESNTSTYDASWLINDAIWDNYFLSAITPDYSVNTAGYNSSGTMEQSLSKFFSEADDSMHLNSRVLPNVNELEIADIVNDLKSDTGFERIARYVMIDGSFNVNSTSVDAWAALFGANRSLEMKSYGAGASSLVVGETIPFPKTLKPLGDSNEAWQGFAGLSETQIQELAAAIVDQVKLRGPFMSLADFVNRRLTTDATGAMGALQAAIESSSLNSGIEASEGLNTDYSDSIFANQKAASSSAGDINAHLTQADLLQPIAPLISARSDTFRIRSYGEIRDPITGKIVSRARCEAVVQRLPDYVDASDLPTVEPADLNTTNIAFGRRYKIVSFKWLTGENV